MTSSGLNANQCKHTANRCCHNPQANIKTKRDVGKWKRECMGVLENDINRVTQSDDGDRQAEAERMDVGKDMEKN